MTLATAARPSFPQSCLLHLRDRIARRRCIAIALVVGTILGTINQGDVVLAGDLTPGVAVKLALNYVVPFAVSSLGYISARRRTGAGGGGEILGPASRSDALESEPRR